MRLNLGRVKPAGVAVQVLWDVVVGLLPRAWHCGVVLAEDLWEGLP